MREYTRLFIDGEWVQPSISRTVELSDPTTNTPFARVAMGGAEDVDRAVAAARRAFATYSETSIADRLDLFDRIIAAYEPRIDELSAVIAEEMGCPVSARVQVMGPLMHFRQARKVLQEYHFESRIGDTIIRREPIGVCGLVSPWNWPIQTLTVKIAYALAAGCTVVCKPSQVTPISAILLTEILEAAKVPKGVVNLVIGEGATVGEAIAAHPEVDLISFTGSTGAGARVGAVAAQTIKRVSLELGGKSANIVLPDADIAAASRWNVQRCFFNTGQSCHAPSRLFIPRNKLDEAVAAMCDEVSKIRIGDPRDPATTMGPMVNRAQFNSVQRYIEIGIEEGATVVCGGPGLPAGVNRGAFVRPTIFTDVTPAMTIAREEIFGPVLAVIAYDDEEEAIAIANNGPFGLAGYVFSGDPDKGYTVGNRLRAGRVFYNGAAGDPASPMGGYKQSGNGREMGIFGLEEYLEIKAVFGFKERAEGLLPLAS
ncbi:aldehyde dehydrogenase family protein [Sinorhizobium garamanticum]|uniref:Aldehyde dehydrogenase family protein n=1 Tax=Sinorhizobium garamanticum TaxID=680247 RepID=A0ABY8DJF2_9HYPH|nr:aldehyde dehydrogenase family protein [Sinorhizobium garamanticum]WEX91041.1 aldehyde dehydrogenase family protein [Sinorhizobium garamanticum]